MKVSEMVEGKTYKCVWVDCAYTGWTAKQILRQIPWMADLDEWEEE